MSHPRATPQGSLGVRVAIGASWLLGMRWSVQLLGLGSTLVLARLLVPEDFGIVALATAYIAIVEGLTALPMSQALIRYRARIARSMILRGRWAFCVGSSSRSSSSPAPYRYPT